MIYGLISTLTHKHISTSKFLCALSGLFSLYFLCGFGCSKKLIQVIWYLTQSLMMFHFLRIFLHRSGDRGGVWSQRLHDNVVCDNLG